MENPSLQDELSALRTEYQTALTTLQREITALRNEVTTLRAEVVRTTASQPQPRPRQQLPEPTKFDGKAHHFRTWLPAIKAKLRVDGQAIGDETARFYYVYSNLEPQVQAMVLPQLSDAEAQGIWDCQSILSQLGRVYENPNQRQEAEDALHNLMQGDKESLASYVAKFERILYEAKAQDWPDNVKISTLRTGLNLTTRRALSTQLSIPESYHGFLRTIQHLSRRQVTYAHDHAPAQDKMDLSTLNSSTSVSRPRQTARRSNPYPPYDDFEEDFV